MSKADNFHPTNLYDHLRYIDGFTSSIEYNIGTQVNYVTFNREYSYSIPSENRKMMVAYLDYEHPNH
jgi:hypothetical protein